MNEIDLAAHVFRALVGCVAVGVFSLAMYPRARVLFPVCWKDAAPLRRALLKLGRYVPFALMCVGVVWLKLAKLQFFYDFIGVTAVFTLYLAWTRRIGVRNSIYAAVIVSLCMDFCVAVVNMIYFSSPVFDMAIKKVFVEALYLVMLLGLCVFLRRYAPTHKDVSIEPKSFLILLLALLPYAVLRGSTMLYIAEGQDSQTLNAVLILSILATFGTFVGNYNSIRAQTEKVHRLQLEMEMAERQKRYEIRKETMAEVNRRYHDMVKYARTFEQTGEAGSLGDYLERKMTDDLDAATLGETGNDAVDLILWEASERCTREGVRLVPAVDARDLGFITNYDLRTIVGNALDNAVEAASGVAEPERREVRLRIMRVNRMVFIRVENYFDGGVNEEAGRLLTTKGDPDLHGYGVENARRAAESYGGSLIYEVEEDPRAVAPADANGSGGPGSQGTPGDAGESGGAEGVGGTEGAGGAEGVGGAGGVESAGGAEGAGGAGGAEGAGGAVGVESAAGAEGGRFVLTAMIPIPEGQA